MTSGVRARDASGQAADQRDELMTFQLTEMHPIPSRAGSTSQDIGLQRISQRDTRAIGEPLGSPRTRSAGLRVPPRSGKKTRPCGAALQWRPAPAARLVDLLRWPGPVSFRGRVF